MRENVIKEGVYDKKVYWYVMNALDGVYTRICVIIDDRCIALDDVSSYRRGGSRGSVGRLDQQTLLLGVTDGVGSDVMLGLE